MKQRPLTDEESAVFTAWFGPPSDSVSIATRRAIRDGLYGARPVVLKEAAASLGTTPDNLRGAIARGALKATKLGRDWIVTLKEVERYRRENRRA